MKIELLPLNAIKPNERNSRTHSDEQVADIAKSITEFGWTVPLLIDEAGTLLAGHGRLRAAQLLGLDAAPCHRKVGLTDAQKRAYVIADNKLAQGSEWDEELLRLELKDLMAVDFDMGALGFDEDELNALLMQDPKPEGGGRCNRGPERCGRCARARAGRRLTDRRRVGAGWASRHVR